MNLSRIALTVLALGLAPAWAAAAVPSDPKERVKLVGQPTALEVRPTSISLDGPKAVQQVIVTGKYADGTVRDLTSFADYSGEPPDLLETAGGFVRGKRNGNAQLAVQAGGQTAKVPVTVT